MGDSPTLEPKGLDEIVREVGDYSMEAFQFVRDGLTTAADRVHGPLSKPQQRIVRWMTERELTLDDILRMQADDQLPGALRDQIEAIGGIESLNRHVSGQQLCLALRDLALERWGMLARTVLARWGIRRTEDFGRIVFALVDNRILSKQPTDTIEDFANVFDFQDAFDRTYRIALSS